MASVKDFPRIPPGTMTSRQVREAWGHVPPNRGELGLIQFTFWDGTVVPGGINPDILAAVEWLDRVFQQFNYPLAGSVGDDWCYARRKIGGSSSWSLHSWGIALDVNATTNPRSHRFKTDMKPDMIRAVQAIQTRTGKKVWQWGGTWGLNHRYKYDPMHFQIAISPASAQALERPHEVDAVTTGETTNSIAVVDVGGQFQTKLDDVDRRIELIESDTALIESLVRKTGFFEAVIAGMEPPDLLRFLFRSVKGRCPTAMEQSELVARHEQGVPMYQVWMELKAPGVVLER